MKRWTHGDELRLIDALADELLSAPEQEVRQVIERHMIERHMIAQAGRAAGDRRDEVRELIRSALVHHEDHGGAPWQLIGGLDTSLDEIRDVIRAAIDHHDAEVPPGRPPRRRDGCAQRAN
jgi:hypothetical protein